MDFNQGSNMKQAKTKEGKERYNVVSSKITKNWTAKPIKERKHRGYLHNMVQETVQLAREKKLYHYPIFLLFQKILLQRQNQINRKLLRITSQDLVN